MSDIRSVRESFKSRRRAVAAPQHELDTQRGVFITQEVRSTMTMQLAASTSVYFKTTSRTLVEAQRATDSSTTSKGLCEKAIRLANADDIISLICCDEDNRCHNERGKKKKKKKTRRRRRRRNSYHTSLSGSGSKLDPWPSGYSATFLGHHSPRKALHSSTSNVER